MLQVWRQLNATVLVRERELVPRLHLKDVVPSHRPLWLLFVAMAGGTTVIRAVIIVMYDVAEQEHVLDIRGYAKFNRIQLSLRGRGEGELIRIRSKDRLMIDAILTNVEFVINGLMVKLSKFNIDKPPLVSR